MLEVSELLIRCNYPHRGRNLYDSKFLLTRQLDVNPLRVLGAGVYLSLSALLNPIGPDYSIRRPMQHAIHRACAIHWIFGRILLGSPHTMQTDEYGSQPKPLVLKRTCAQGTRDWLSGSPAT